MPNTPNPEFLRRAIALATENVVNGRGGPFAAVIVPSFAKAGLRDGIFSGRDLPGCSSTSTETGDLPPICTATISRLNAPPAMAARARSSERSA